MDEVKNKLKCPNCKTTINVEELVFNTISNKINEEAEAKIRKEINYENKNNKQKEIDEAVENAIIAYKKGNAKDTLELIELRKQKLNFDSEKAEAIHLGKKEAFKEFEHLSNKDSKEISRLSTQLMSEKLERQKQENILKEFNKNKDEAIKLATEVEVQKIRQKDETEKELVLQAKDNRIEALEKGLNEAIRKSNQQSVQVQGEIAEIHIERKLREEFPKDKISEVKKGQNGADTMHYVINKNGVNAGLIYIETKNTENFQNSWVQKLKSDMIEKKAHIGILITKTMPPHKNQCHFKDGIWICSFHEFLGLVKSLRFHLIESVRLLAVKEMTSEKSKELFTYITSLEFNTAMEKMLTPIMNQKMMFETEKRAIRKSWAAREKFIEQSLEGADLVWGSLRALAGQSMPSLAIMDELETLEDFENNLIDTSKRNVD